MPNKFVSIREAARLTGATECSLRKMYHAGKLPGYDSISGKKFHVNLDALREMLGCTYVDSDDFAALDEFIARKIVTGDL